MNSLSKPLVLFALLSLLFYACQEDVTDQPEPDNTANECVMKTQKEGNVVLTYHYNNKRLSMATYSFGDTTWFEYDGTGLMNRIKDKYGYAQLNYNTEGKVALIEKFESGKKTDFYKLEYESGNVSKVNSYIITDSVNAAQVLGITYNASKEMQSLYLDYYEKSISGYLRFLEADSIKTDGRVNPYSKNIGYIYMNLENPFAYGPSNITDGKLEVLGQPTTIATTYNYDQDDYLIEADIDIPNWEKHTFFTYECW